MISRSCIAVLALSASLGSCSLFAPSTQGVTVTSSDPQAEIFIDGNLVGRGAVSVSLRRNQSHTVMAKIGDRVGTSSIGTSISTTGVLDIVGGVFFLIPLIGVAGPGFWNLDPQNVTVVLPQPASGN